MNWYVLIPVGIGIIALIGFLIWRNVKDEKDLEDQLKNDYHKPPHDKADAEPEEAMK